MRPTLLLSDLHLAPERPSALAAFHRFAQGPARNAAAVYILGDLFDAWVGDDQLAEPYARAVAEDLRDLVQSGVPVYVARGNRDFLLDKRFVAASGATLLPEHTIVDLAGIRTLLTHGDELCTDDVDYQRYRKWSRNPRVQTPFRLLPYRLRRRVALTLRRQSLAAIGRKPEAILDVNTRAVEDTFRTLGVTRIIHGHTHRPARHALDVDGTLRERYVLADWHDDGQFLEVDANGVRSREISARASDLKPR